MTFESYLEQVLETLAITGIHPEADLSEHAMIAFKDEIDPYDFAESIMSDKDWCKKKPVVQQMGRAHTGSLTPPINYGSYDPNFKYNTPTTIPAIVTKFYVWNTK